MSTKVGFIGLGNMGFPMASNLLKAGYEVYGVDVNQESEARLAAVGGKIGFTSSALVDQVNVIFTSLPTPEIVESVYLGESNLIRNANEKKKYLLI